MLISFRIDWLDLLAVQGTLKSLLQHHSSKASILWCSAFFMVQLSYLFRSDGKTVALTRWTFVSKVTFLLFHVLFVIAFLPRSKHQTDRYLFPEDTLDSGTVGPEMKLALGFVSGISITGLCVLRLSLDRVYGTKKGKLRKAVPPSPRPLREQESRGLQRNREGRRGPEWSWSQLGPCHWVDCDTQPC